MIPALQAGLPKDTVTTVDIPPLLHTALTMAVPLEIMRLREQPDYILDDLQRSLPAGLQRGADAMMFGGSSGEAASAFAAHVRTFAVLALRAEGGVDFCGLHWCAIPNCRAASRFDHADITGGPSLLDTPPDKPPTRSVHTITTPSSLL